MCARSFPEGRLAGHDESSVGSGDTEGRNAVVSRRPKCFSLQQISRFDHLARPGFSIRKPVSKRPVCRSLIDSNDQQARSFFYDARHMQVMQVAVFADLVPRRSAARVQDETTPSHGSVYKWQRSRMASLVSFLCLFSLSSLTFTGFSDRSKVGLFFSQCPVVENPLLCFRCCLACLRV